MMTGGSRAPEMERVVRSIKLIPTVEMLSLGERAGVTLVSLPASMQSVADWPGAVSNTQLSEDSVIGFKENQHLVFNSGCVEVV